MGFRFLHAADLHLGSPLKGLSLRDPALAARVADASRQAFRDLIDRAIAADVAFAVIAGDIFDRDWRDFAIGQFFVAELTRLTRAGIRVFLIKGNHDADSEVTRALRLPDGVHVFPSARAETVRPEGLPVAIHGRSFADARVREDLALHYPDALPQLFNIGVLHTSLDGRPGQATYAPTTPTILKAKGYDYWALGHIHAFEVVGRTPAIVFPGILQGRDMGETGPKGGVLVSVDDRLAIGAIDRVIVDRVRFLSADVPLDGLEDRDRVLAALDAAVAGAMAASDGRFAALRLRLTGATAQHRALVADRVTLEAEAANAILRVGADAALESLVIDTSAPAQTLLAASDLVDAAALIAGADTDPALKQGIEEALARLIALLPADARAASGLVAQGATGVDPAVLDGLIAEARDLILGRLTETRP